METSNKNLNKPAINAKDQEKSIMPQDFKNFPINNSLGIDPEILMTALRNKKDWADPDQYGITSPEVCARISHTWSNEYLILNNLI